MLIVEAIVLPIYSFLYNVNLLQPGLLLTLLLGSIGYIVVGTLLAAMSVHSRTRDVMLPILLFPVVIPVLIAAVKASGGYLTGDDFANIRPWLNVLVAYDVIFTVDRIHGLRLRGGGVDARSRPRGPSTSPG